MTDTLDLVDLSGLTAWMREKTKRERRKKKGRGGEGNDKSTRRRKVINCRKQPRNKKG